MKYTVSDFSSRLGVSNSEVYRRLANLGIVGSPTQHYITEYGKQFAEESYIRNDRYGRHYWLQTFKGIVLEMLRENGDNNS